MGTAGQVGACDRAFTYISELYWNIQKEKGPIKYINSTTQA
jgi:hypothetical protein